MGLLLLPSPPPGINQTFTLRFLPCLAFLLTGCKDGSNWQRWSHSRIGYKKNCLTTPKTDLRRFGGIIDLIMVDTSILYSHSSIVSGCEALIDFTLLSQIHRIRLCYYVGKKCMRLKGLIIPSTTEWMLKASTTMIYSET